TVPKWFFDFNLDGIFEYCTARLDVGAIQGDSLNVDPLATLRAADELAALGPELVRREVEALRPCSPSLIIADIPALALDVAAELGVPGVAMTNFSWDWIYADYVQDHRSYHGLVSQFSRSYGRSDLLLRLPLHGDLSAFPRIRDLPFVARRSKLDR